MKLVVVALSVASVLALSPSDFKVPELPDYVDSKPLPENYAGFLPVTEPADQKNPDAALFFWLFVKP